ncbi:guanine-specific ribonuclease N1 and T1 [Streptomyces sp. BR123]|uniref:ribonuclease domain-containing protein n=1 Tax=Streptomyces sp. BR123 TaxID=2749828 RepID=UPI0015C43308|nr:ribonuclease domain-containing protein [Streptomyces sp. BR123]NXY94909.1 guanine-specific ribonuclease N1 and T1 [Streptomyces sp. BR123]
MIFRTVPRSLPSSCPRLLGRLLGALFLCVALVGGATGCGGAGGGPSAADGTRGGTRAGASAWAAGMATVRADALPREARDTLALIDKGGPYPYRQDGAVFGNFEKLLPRQKRGYYHEYTVKTPGRPDRGPRRMVTGQGGEFYYTDDHYHSFKAVLR